MSESKTNIDGSSDPFYRYQRPKITVRHHASNKTFLTNLEQVCKSLRTPPEALIGYIGKTHSISTNAKKGWIKGIWSVAQIEEQIVAYCQIYVLCQQCGLPEILAKGRVSKNYLKCRCQACGAQYKRSDVNPTLLKWFVTPKSSKK